MIKRIKTIIKNYRNYASTVISNKEEIKKIKLLINDNDTKTMRIVEQDRLHNAMVEEGIMKMYEVLEYKFYEEKMLNNKMFYRETLRNHIDEYNVDFNPLVSIIIPVYNGSNYLKYAIDSALNQTYKNIEIIVVNDGSNDNGESEKIAKSYGNKIKYIYKENGGVSSALNVGIKKMEGDYFAWLSHDDVIYENHIQEHIEYLRYCHNKDVITYTCFNIIDSDGRIRIPNSIVAGIHISDYKLSLNTHYACILRGDVNGGNILIPRDAFQKCGYFEEGNRISQEKEMWSRLLKLYRFVNIPIVTYSIRSHDKQVTNVAGDVLEETEKKLLEIIEDIPTEDMIKESGTVDRFYLDLYIHYKNNGLKRMQDEMYSKYIKSTNK